MKKLAIAILGLLGLLSAAAFLLLTTGAGLRWTVDQVLTRVDVPVEIGGVSGRLIGPVSLTDVSYRDTASGTGVTLDSVELDWRPRELLGGVLHVTRLRLAGVEYTPGTGDGSSSGAMAPPSLDVALPFEVLVERLEVESAALAGGGEGVPRIERASLRATLDADAITLEDVNIAAGRYGVAGGRVRLGLAPALPIETDLEWRAEPEGFPAFHGALKLDGSFGGTLRPRVHLRRPFVAEARGTLRGLFGSPGWTLTTRLPDRVALDTVSPAWPAASVRGTLTAEGDLAQARLQPDLALSFQGQEAGLTGEAVIDRDGLVVESARLTRPDRSDAVELSGDVRFTDALPFSLAGSWESLRGPETAPWSSRSGELRASGDRRQVTAELSGVVTPPGQEDESAVSLELEARGLDGDPVVRGSLQVPYLNVAGVTVRELAATVDFNAAGQPQSSITLDVATIQYGEHAASGVALRGQGSLDRHEVSLSADYQDWSVQTRLAGGYADGRWRGAVEALGLESGGPAPVSWRLKSPANLSASVGEVDLASLCLQRAGAEVCGSGRFAAGEDWGVDLHTAALPLTWLATGAPDTLQIEGTLSAQASVGNRGSGIEGEANARVDRASVAWTGDEPVTTRYEELELTATLNETSLTASIDGTVEGSGTIDGELTTQQPLAADGPISGRLSARLPSLRLLQAFVPALGLQEGEAVVALQVDGTRNAPRFDGEARVKNAVVDVSPLGIRLSAVDLAVRGQPGGRLSLEGSADAGEGTLSASGDFGRTDGGAWQGEIRVQGDNAQLTSLPKAVITGNPDLRVAIDESGGRVSGRIELTHAVLTPDAGHPGVTISDDIVVVSEDTEQVATNPMAWHAGVTIALGDDTRFSGYGVKGRLTGSIELDAPPQQPTRANGRIEIRDGTYTLYGNSFDIERGAIIYAGGPVDNPGIDVRIGREAGDVSVSLSVSGQLVEPNLSLSASRPMSETDKMSYLLLGRPAAEASGAEAGLLLRAASSLVPGGAGGVPRFLRSNLGLDTVEVRQGVGEEEGAAVELGKYLSPRLYVSYVAGFQQSVDVFRVRYDLARHWLLRAESSTRGSGGDLLFTW